MNERFVGRMEVMPAAVGRFVEGKLTCGNLIT